MCLSSCGQEFFYEPTGRSTWPRSATDGPTAQDCSCQGLGEVLLLQYLLERGYCLHPLRAAASSISKGVAPGSTGSQQLLPLVPLTTCHPWVSRTALGHFSSCAASPGTSVWPGAPLGPCASKNSGTGASTFTMHLPAFSPTSLCLHGPAWLEQQVIPKAHRVLGLDSKASSYVGAAIITA